MNEKSRPVVPTFRKPRKVGQPLQWWRRGGPAPHGDTGLFIGAPDVDAVYAHLRTKGLDMKEPKVAPYGMKQLYVRDPDGYGICFQWKANG